MRLSRQNLEFVSAHPTLRIPDNSVFSYPEKVLQFGTGVFLRGLIDYYIDKANNENIFSGRVMLVKSTDAGDLNTFSEQDCLYTLLMKSADKGAVVDDKIICAAVSRVIDANTEWNKILLAAADPEINIIISNTTEIGIVLDEDDLITHKPPASFPGKLLAVLFQRFIEMNGAAGTGFVIIPTELIPDNGLKLKKIVNQLAHKNELSLDFIEWLNSENDFCNSLVDRIVPGKLRAIEQKNIETELGYEDNLMIMAETFGLWAIETTSERTRELLSFSLVNPGIHIVDNIEKFRELKLRLLNGSHNLSCALGVIAGFNTVKEAMENEVFDAYMQRLILGEIAAAILSENISPDDARQFGSSVLERYRNPFIEFEWLSICVQDTSKIKIRAVPVIRQHHAKYGYVPDGISLGFAAYILFMRSVHNPTGQYVGSIDGRSYTITDDFAGNLFEKWQSYKGIELVRNVLQDESIWETNLFLLQGFAESVTFYLENLISVGFFKTVNLHFHEETLKLK